MNKAQRFLKTYEKALLNKNVVLTGCTGGIGKELCRFILSLGGNLLMVDRNEEKSLNELSKRVKKPFKTVCPYLCTYCNHGKNNVRSKVSEKSAKPLR